MRYSCNFIFPLNYHHLSCCCSCKQRGWHRFCICFESLLRLVLWQNHILLKAMLSKFFLSSQASDILSSFDDRLRQYATKQLTKVRDVWFIEEFVVPYLKYVLINYSLYTFPIECSSLTFVLKRTPLESLIIYNLNPSKGTYFLKGS